MEFEKKQFDGPYEVIEIDIDNCGEIFKGLLYFPPQAFIKPYPLIIYFHGFPQLFPLQDIIRSYQFTLDMGFAFLLFNFRGYRYSEGNISIEGQFSDAMHILEFADKLAQKGIFDGRYMNIIAHDFGAYIALILCSKTHLVRNLLLISPLLNINRHVADEKFKEVLAYINRFLPGNIRGIENIENFIEYTKNELLREELQWHNVIKYLKIDQLKIIIGELDKVTPLSEIDYLKQNSNISPHITIIRGMDHYSTEDEQIEEINLAIKNFFKKHDKNNQISNTTN